MGIGLVRFVAVGAAFSFASPALAANIAVTTTSDESSAGDHVCSLREAVAAVNSPGTSGDCGTASGDGNTITLGAHRYQLSIAPTGPDDNSSGDLEVDSLAPVTVTGAGVGSTLIAANGLGDRVLTVAFGASLTLRALTLTGGHAPDGAAGSSPANAVGGTGGAGANGGGILNGGSLTVIDAAVSDNTAGSGGKGGDGGFASSTGLAGGMGGAGGAGGAIYSTGTLVLTEATVNGDRAGDGGNGGDGHFNGPGVAGPGGNGGCCGDGGGIANVGGVVVIDRSTISFNHAGNGGSGGNGGDSNQFPDAGLGGTGAGGSSGGAVASAGGSLSITNSTLSSNLTGNGGSGGNGGPAFTGLGGAGGGAGNGSAGGGVFVRAGGASSLLNVTVDANQVGGPGASGNGGSGAPNGAAGNPAFGGGFYDNGAPAMSVVNTLLATNAAGNCSGSFTDGGRNLGFGDSSCGMTFAGGDPRLGVLQSNGGPTQTVGLQTGSGAIDQVPASAASCPKVDQRGVARPAGTLCDIGAFELAKPTVSTSPPSQLMPTSVTLGGTVTANQASANAQFEFGTTSAYGSQTPGQTIAGLTPTSVSAALSGLSPNTVYHYRLVATSPDGTTMSADATFTTAGNLRPVLKPALTLLAIKPASFFAAPAKRGRKTGATISYLDAVAGRTTFVVFKETAGMRVHGRCLKLPKHRHRPSCVRQIKLGGFTHGDRAGRNTLHFSGRLASKKLAPGRYLLRATPRLGAMTGPIVTIGFRIL